LQEKVKGSASVKYKVDIVVKRKPGILDPEGNTIFEALKRLGSTEIESVKVSKMFQLVVSAPSEKIAFDTVTGVSGKILINPIIEDFTVGVVEPVEE
jgi:phosphoribosylformylglycinamidine synthase subunit PurS